MGHLVAADTALSNVRKCFGSVVETDDVDDHAAPDGEHLKSECRPAPLLGALRTPHAHAHQKAITKDLDVVHASPDARLSASLIPRQDLVAALAVGIGGSRRSPRHRWVQEFGEGCHILRRHCPSHQRRRLFNAVGHRSQPDTGSGLGPVSAAATSPFLVRQVFAAAVRIGAPLDYLSSVHDATALGATHLHFGIFSLGNPLGGVVHNAGWERLYQAGQSGELVNEQLRCFNVQEVSRPI